MDELTAASLFFRDAGAVSLLDKDLEEVAVAHYRALRDKLPLAHKAVALAESFLVRANLRLVSKLARKHGRDDEEISDLEQVGNEELVKAIRTFDPTRGTRLSTYVTPHVRGAILSAVRNNDTIRITRYARVSVDGKPNKNHTDKPNPILPRVTASLEDPLRGDLKVQDTIPDESPGALELLVGAEDQGRALEALATLSVLESRILGMYFGLGGAETMTQGEISPIVGKSPEMVTFIKLKALKKLRKVLE